MKYLTTVILLISSSLSLVYGFVLDYERLNEYLPDVQVYALLDDFDPFQLELIQKQSIAVKNDEDDFLREQVIETIGHNKVGGVVLGRGSISSKILINGWVFGLVDEIRFPDEQGRLVSPLPGKSLLLISINESNFDVRVRSDDGSQTTTVCVPLDSFFT